ncbi:hypothetical protein D9756_000567 [Leucocoprinus leucothites]|uniref:Rab proteins geranylgeranyltransferase n=1 Tax=Leucocoprinus leucothites TaxID=201217 RepID=A0A8H5LND8_9AGAR|nr:hypothetical protein D9756_000567 [Leucoagaricus leucothites]
MEDSKFDVIILGTGLTESIVAAALSKWGFRVAHIDQNPYYGGEEASLTLEEFAKWIDSISSTSGRFSHGTRSGTVPPYARHYSICLCPTINPALGSFVDALIQSGVSKYSGFRLLERVAVYDGTGAFRAVPGSKEDVFKNKDISLIQKRRLMRFLTFAVGDFEQSSELQGKHDLPFTDFLDSVFSLSHELVTVITYALAYSSQPIDSTISVLPRIRRYLRSVGRYGTSPFLVGHYGGVGEISQGFCRTAAVNGAVYILGRQITSISTYSPSARTSETQPTLTDTSPKPYHYSVTLEDIPECLHARAILSSPSYIPDQMNNQSQCPAITPPFRASYTPTCAVRCIAIIEHSILLHPPAPENNDVNDDDSGDEDGGDDQPEEEEGPIDKALDTAVLVFPPNSLNGGSPDSSAVVLMTGEGTLSAPKGKYILYIYLPVFSNGPAHASQMLEPYLNAVLRLGREEPQTPLFTAFYTENLGAIPPCETDSQRHAPWIIPPPVPLGPLGDVADAATQNAEILFHAILEALGDSEGRYQKGDSYDGGIWPKIITTEEED